MKGKIRKDYKVRKGMKRRRAGEIKPKVNRREKELTKIRRKTERGKARSNDNTR